MNLRFIYKVIGAVFAIVGIVIIAKHGSYLQGLILLFAGFYLAMKEGMKPR